VLSAAGALREAAGIVMAGSSATHNAYGIAALVHLPNDPSQVRLEY